MNWCNPKSIPPFPIIKERTHLRAFHVTFWNYYSSPHQPFIHMDFFQKKSSLADIMSFCLVPLLPLNAPDFAAWFPKQRQVIFRWLWHPRLKQQLDFDPSMAANKSFSTKRVQASMPFSNNNPFTALCIIFPSEKTFVHRDDSCCSWGQWQTSHSLQWCKGWVAAEQSTLEHHTMRLYFL